MKITVFISVGFLILLFFLTITCQTVNPEERYGFMLDQYLKAWNTGDVDILDDVVAEQFELRMTPHYTAKTGLDSLKHEIRSLRTAYPDFRITINEMVYSEKAVTARWTIRATNTGPGSHPPTGKEIEVTGMSLLHLANGKIQDEWIASNNIVWLNQLGFTLHAPAEMKTE